MYQVCLKETWHVRVVVFRPESAALQHSSTAYSGRCRYQAIVTLKLLHVTETRSNFLMREHLLGLGKRADAFTVRLIETQSASQTVLSVFFKLNLSSLTSGIVASPIPRSAQCAVQLVY